jgi:hypothetical protein
VKTEEKDLVRDRTNSVRGPRSRARRLASATGLPRAAKYIVALPSRWAAKREVAKRRKIEEAVDTRRDRRRATLERLSANKQPVVLFLAPDAGLKPYYASHSLLAKTVLESGRAAVMLSCNGLLPICSWKFARGMGPTAPGDAQNPACESCTAQARETGEQYGLIDIAIETLVGERERAKIAEILADNAAAAWETSYDGIEFGALAKGEVLRSRRLLEMSEFTESDHRLLVSIVHSALAIYFAVKRFAETHNLVRIAYFGDYPYWLATVAFAQRRGIAVTNVDHAYHRDIDRRLIGLREGSVNVHMFDRQIHSWPRYRDRPITKEAVERIADSGMFRLVGHGGLSTFSPNWVLRDTPIQVELGLSQEKKTLVAYPSSSDEVVALRQIMALFGKPYGAGEQPFADQVDWLEALTRWAGARDDVQLVIRMHPRIGLSHRHTAKASEYDRYKSVLATLPSNVVVIWPEDKVSSYNLAEVADLALVSWSTIGMELARFGIPVIAAFSGYGSYPTGGFAKFTSDRADHFRLIEQMVGARSSMADVTDAFRWSHYVHVSPLVDVSDVVPSPDFADVPAWSAPRNVERIRQVFIDGKDLSEVTMDALPRGAAAERLEREALVSTLTQFLSFFAAGTSQQNFDLDDVRPEEGGWINYRRAGGWTRRFSPLCARLVHMLRAEPDGAVNPSGSGQTRPWTSH